MAPIALLWWSSVWRSEMAQMRTWESHPQPLPGTPCHQIPFALINLDLGLWSQYSLIRVILTSKSRQCVFLLGENEPRYANGMVCQWAACGPNYWWSREKLSLTHRLINPYAYLTHLDGHTLKFWLDKIWYGRSLKQKRSSCHCCCCTFGTAAYLQRKGIKEMHMLIVFVYVCYISTYQYIQIQASTTKPDTLRILAQCSTEFSTTLVWLLCLARGACVFKEQEKSCDSRATFSIPKICILWCYDPLANSNWTFWVLIF